MTKLAACDAGTEAVVANTNSFVFERVGKVVLSFGHGSHKDANAFLWGKTVNVVTHSNNISVEGECDFSTVWRQVICYWVLDDLEQFFLRVDGPDGELVEELNHEASKSLECSRNANGGADFDQHALGGVDIDL